MDSAIFVGITLVVLAVAGIEIVKRHRAPEGRVGQASHRLVSLGGEKIIDRWYVVLEGAAGAQEYLLTAVLDALTGSELPGVRWSTVDVAPAFVKGVLGKRRPYLCIENQDLSDFRMYVGARPYGKHLYVVWLLTVEPGIVKRLLSFLLTYTFLKRGDARAMSFQIDLFDEQELRAYVTAVHRCCVKRAVERVVEQMGQDHSKFDWRSKGFLSVW